MSASNIAIKQTFGDFIQTLSSSQEYLILSFSPGSIPLRQRWRNNCLSADFLADYLSTFFLGDNSEQPAMDKQAEVKSAVGYIANELLENGMKYCVETSSFPISIQIHLSTNLIVFQLTNSLTIKQTQRFQKQIKKLLNGDPSEMYLAQLEQNALEENNTASNLGLLTMLNDYEAKLGWKFEPLFNQSAEMMVTTTVQVSI